MNYLLLFRCISDIYQNQVQPRMHVIKFCINLRRLEQHKSFIREKRLRRDLNCSLGSAADIYIFCAGASKIQDQLIKALNN